MQAAATTAGATVYCFQEPVPKLHASAAAATSSSKSDVAVAEKKDLPKLTVDAASPTALESASAAAASAVDKPKLNNEADLAAAADVSSADMMCYYNGSGKPQQTLLSTLEAISWDQSGSPIDEIELTSLAMDEQAKFSD